MKKLILGILLIGLSLTAFSQTYYKVGSSTKGGYKFLKDDGEFTCESTYPSVIDDGNTENWYIAHADNITNEGGGSVSQWDDLSGNDNHLTQTTPAYYPTFSGDSIHFDGSDGQLRLVGQSFTSPFTLYMVVNIHGYKNSAMVFAMEEGYLSMSNYYGGVADHTSLVFNAGTDLLATGVCPIGEWVILRITSNGTSSSIQVNETTATTGNAGTTTLTRIEISKNDGASMGLKEVILRLVDDSTSDEQDIYDYLEDKL